MNFKTPQLLSHTPPILEVPAHHVWHRVQRKNGRSDSVRLKGYVLAPPGGLAGRLDLAGEATTVCPLLTTFMTWNNVLNRSNADRSAKSIECYERHSSSRMIHLGCRPIR
jgi:hypothetical protein